VQEFVHDQELQELLYINRSFTQVYDTLLNDDFLQIDPSIRVPFFAQTRDYVGAAVKGEPGDVWIVKPIQGKDVLETEMATICFFWISTRILFLLPLVLPGLTA
ncbi:MAG: hypothetical protein ACOC7U_07170, partial [Spirochaetota bacterium]